MMRKHIGWRALAAASAAAILVGGGLAIDAASASAQNQVAQQQLSGNWSGYVVRSSAGKNFSSVSGSWVQPSVSADSRQGYAAFWVGLGGASEQSQALEQVGTAAQVVNGKTSYYAWYELVPSAQVRLNLAIHPGDHMSGKVTVSGTSVTVSLSDSTTGSSASKTLQMSSPDTSSAEWIAEAPAAEFADGSMQILPLADFSKVTFTDASATADGHAGAITDPGLTADQVEMGSGATVQDVSGSGFFGGAGVDTGSGQQQGGASAGSLSDGGSTFTVSYTSDAGTAQSQSAGGSSAAAGQGGYGYPGGDGYPGGYGSASGYGYSGGYGYPGVYVYPGDGYAVLGWITGD